MDKTINGMRTDFKTHISKTINFIVPYFGDFPNYFQLFLDSCGNNPEFTWTIVTDNIREYRFPTNVIKVQESFDKVKERMRDKFDFTLSIDSPHKLCEYKPAYGYIFDEYIKDFDYWGYCDIDVIYGKLSDFLSDELLDSYEKLFTLGHFTIIKNCDRCNRMFMNPIGDKLLYKEAFSSPDNYNFDEEFVGKESINDLFKNDGCLIYENSDIIADIYTKSSDFRLTYNKDGEVFTEEKKRSIFIHGDAVLNRYELIGDKLYKKEFMYIHLQKRNMRIEEKVYDADCYSIIPNAFECIESELTQQNVAKMRFKRFNLHYFVIRFNNLKIKTYQFVKKQLMG